METRANYVIVGIFTLVAVVAAFAFVYWASAIGDRGETTTLRMRIPGSASGLGRGSAVLFNGVKVGDIRRVYIDVLNPTVAVADAEVDRLTPITKSTQADIGIAGLTGQANIELKRREPPTSPTCSTRPSGTGKTAEIVAEPVGGDQPPADGPEHLQARRQRAHRPRRRSHSDVRGPLTQTAGNIEKFSQALASNSDGIDKFLSSVSALSEELAGVSGKLDGTLTAAEEPARIRSTARRSRTSSAMSRPSPRTCRSKARGSTRSSAA